jgi:hypothetical protein
MDNDDLAPEHDALDAMFWNVVEEGMSALRQEFTKQAERSASISFRRAFAVFERAERIARRERNRAVHGR